MSIFVTMVTKTVSGVQCSALHMTTVVRQWFICEKVVRECVCVTFLAVGVCLFCQVLKVHQNVSSYIVWNMQIFNFSFCFVSLWLNFWHLK